MSETVGEGVVRIRTDESGVDYGGAGKRAGEGYSKGFVGSLKSIAIGIGSVLAARQAIDFVKDSVAEAREAQKVGAATVQIIKATGGAANVTANQVGALSTKLSLATGIDDELIQSGQNLILTFKNVRNEAGKNNDIFDRATKSALDLSAAGFGSVESASVQLGKALNDPIKGIAALGRSGVTFTQAQKDQIEALVKSGDLLSAQKIILGEVEHQVGGVAEATATSGEKAVTAWNNVKEAVGTALLPILDRVLDYFSSKIAPALLDFIAGTSPLNDVFRRIGDTAGPVLELVRSGLATAKDAVGDFVSGLRGGEGSDDTAVGRIAARIGELAKTVLPQVVAFVKGTVIPIFSQLVGQLRVAAEQVLPVMSATFQGKILPALKAVGSYVIANVVPIFAQLADIFINDVIPLAVQVATIVYGTLYPALIDVASAVVKNLLPVFDQLVATFRDQVLPTVQKLITQIREELLPALLPVVQRVIQVVGGLLKFAAAILGVVLPPLIKFIGFLLEHLVPVVVTIITYVARFVSKLFDLGAAIGNAIGDVGGLVKAYVDFQQGILDAVLGLPGKIIAVVKSLYRAGKKLIGGLLDGILEAAKGVGGVVADIASGIKDAVVAIINDVIDLVNNGIPDKIAIPGAPDINLPNNPIPHLATGTSSWRGGTALVGEQGPELVNLPRGAQVIPAGRTAAILGAPSAPPVQILIDKLMPHDYSEFSRQALAEAQRANLGTRRPLVAGGVS